ncbi:lysis protein [Pantoea brenneri]|jgi:prophage endopeptidase|uniref:Lysis protein n=2 Tax=root TaxID=1 RepID=A0A7Y6NFU7_9GAMM|nr:lysis protein [Pantoea brenneri]DAE22972.1 MAG TPA: Rz lysis protein [Siphoviridae sp. ct2u94]NUY50421.1 lysis protein [Pantoea brenneri]NUY60675.1 lysis protein [Pantoea brenneri]NUY65252.1 lysis protein [Pantoea brenneri]
MKWLADNWKVLATAALILLCAGMAKTASYYHGKFVSADSLATERQETITDMQRRQQSVAALDAKYTKELADAKATIDQLHDDVTTGKRRLQLNATCQKQSSSGTSGVGDDSTARLTADAERNYWRLRSGISTITNQVTYLQDYINRICLK